MNANGTPLREDRPFCDAAVNSDILEHAPQSEEHFFIVPKIIE
jgi:aspartyl-tRNA(Asn)/glutamyl-tRNA(Gln) amidotransferase subunit C